MHPDPNLILPVAYTASQLPFVIVHASCGGLALFMSVIAIATRKGGPTHRLAGRVFTAAMVGVALTAFVISVIRPNPFLFGIGVFSLYLSVAGWLAARGRIGFWGVTLARAMVAAGLGMACTGVAALGGVPLARGLLEGGGPMFVVFGTLGAFRARVDLRAARAGKETRNARMVRHVGLMIGAAIATWTAFAVVNDAILNAGAQLPIFLVWFGPTLIGAPLIVWWQRRLSSVRRVAPVASGACVSPSSSSTAPT